MLLKHLVFSVCLFGLSDSWVTCQHIQSDPNKSENDIHQRPFRIDITKMSAETFVQHIAVNSSISPTTGSLSFYVNVLQNTPKVYANVEMLLASSNGAYNLVLVNKTINYCQLLHDRKYEPMLQTFYKLLTKSTGFPTSCPIRKVTKCDRKVYKIQPKRSSALVPTLILNLYVCAIVHTPN